MKRRKQYASDMTDQEWGYLKGLIAEAKKGGQPRTTNMREVMNGIFYVVRTQYRPAHEIGVTPIRISQIVNGQRAISVDTTLRLARYFGTSATVWLRLQVCYDLEVAEKS